MTPDFSPDALKSFLRSRVASIARASYPSFGRSAERGAKADLRMRSGVSREDFELAFKGDLLATEPRRKIWAALWIDPAEVGVTLVGENGGRR
ncbi:MULTISPECIES: hypothetical protein [unclassified Rhizobium]|uniref:hypothetical protein n=1 Tax=unclassified Rhizobium TaxID=2613769 RepID=UPI00146BB984|nr:MULTISPECIES: hypothetical protein [unclassified Rhizobium]MBD9445777.1 hypothetical protein [Rhizobium sp. RHZ01]NMN73878.1 hypothetical protein [Rhizobium sp. 57MFTsu3.2]